MSQYQSVLLAIDVIEESRGVLEKAAQTLAPDGTLIVFHCIEPIPYPDYYTGNLLEEIQTQAIDDANRALHDLIGLCDIDAARCKVEVQVARASHAITRAAEKNNCDLIVVGSHGRHGLRLILGSTANAVLHHAECDVLAVRIKD